MIRDSFESVFANDSSEWFTPEQLKASWCNESYSCRFCSSPVGNKKFLLFIHCLSYDYQNDPDVKFLDTESLRLNSRTVWLNRTVERTDSLNRFRLGERNEMCKSEESKSVQDREDLKLMMKVMFRVQRSMKWTCGVKVRVLDFFQISGSLKLWANDPTTFIGWEEYFCCLYELISVPLGYRFDLVWHYFEWQIWFSCVCVRLQWSIIMLEAQRRFTGNSGRTLLTDPPVGRPLVILIYV